MTPQLKSTLKTPLIGKIYELDDYIESVSTLPPKRMQRLIVEPMMHQVGILHQQAMRELQQVINSYFGMMMHAAEYKTQKRIVQKILNSEYGKWVYFKEEPHHFICKIRKEFSQAAMSAKDIQEIDNNLKTSIYDSNAN